MSRFHAFPPLAVPVLAPVAAAVLAAFMPAVATGPAAETRAATETRIFADRIEGRTDGEIRASGQVVVQRGGRQLEAEWMTLFEPTQEIRAGDKTRLQQKGDILEGGALYLKDDSREGSLEMPVYTLGKRTGRGDAVRLLFEGPDKYRLNQARYTACPAGNDDWYIRARELELDYTRNVGLARNATIEFMGVPFLYAPWLDFSLDGSRKSGFLAPTIGTTGSGGFDLTLPYYWNIAPDRDATISPRFISKRGLLLNNEFRYLGQTYGGQITAEYIHKDQVFGDSRDAQSWQHRQLLAPSLAADINMQRTSDDRYFADFGDRIAVASKTFLPREGTLLYSGIPGLSTYVRAQRYQTLQDPANPVAEPYARLPQVVANYSQSLFGMPAEVQNEAVRFRHSTQINGERFLTYPSLRLPLATTYGFLTPKIGAHFTRYSLEDDRNLTRNLPIFSVDGGLFFDREFTFRGQDLIQSLEPRLYYVRIPYRDQSRIPNFDAGITDFSFAQMFNENQFSGSDRINDANQLTVALTSRIIRADDGSEQIRFAIGQRYYFDQPRVFLNSPGDSGGDANTSDLIMAVGGQPAEHYSVDAAWQYSRQNNRSQKIGLNLRYQPESDSLINLRYRLDRLTDIKQVDFSSQWKLGGGWYGLIRQNWSIRDDRSLEQLAGVEYNGGCWVLRMVAQRFVTSNNENSSSFFLQLELNDLGKLGANPLETLRQSIPGYTKLNATPLN